MVDKEKVAAVRRYLSVEFPDLEVRDHYDSERIAQCFEVGQGRRSSVAIISRQFFEDHEESQIPAMLKAFLLVEHLRECDLPILVGNEGLSLE
jgi:hypothetical protein